MCGMLTVLLECRDHETELAHTLSGLVPAAVDGLVSDVVILDLGSSDGSARVAEAAGCRFHSEWKLEDILTTVRGEWLLILEAGARPQPGWIEEVGEYVAVQDRAARFSPARHHRRPLLRRIMSRTPPLELGLLLPKRQALSVVRPGQDLSALWSGVKPARLRSELLPARTLRAIA